MVFSEFTNKVKYSNRIPSHLQRKWMSGFTECLIMSCCLILCFHNGMHIKKMSISVIWQPEDKFYTVYFIFNILNVEQLNIGKNGRRRKFLTGGIH